MKHFLIFILLSFASQSNAIITFEKTYGGTEDDYGYSVQQTTDSGYIIAGGTFSYGEGYKDLYLIKTNSSGDTLWTKTYGGSLDDESGHSIQKTTDGGYIIAGYAASFGPTNGDIYLVKTGSAGDTLWTRIFGGLYPDDAYSVRQTSDKGYIIAGTTIPDIDSAGNEDVYLVKTDSLGNELWAKTYGGIYEDRGYSVWQTKDDGFIISGWTGSFGAGTYDIYLIRTDSSGDTLWTKTFGGPNWDCGYSVQQTKDSGFIVVGVKYSSMGYSDIYLIKTDPSGDTLWTKTFGGLNNDGGSAIQQTKDNGYIIAGTTCSFGEGLPYSNIYLLKIDSSGNILWTKTFGGLSTEEGYSVQQTYDNGFIIAGYTFSFGAGRYDVYLVKTDSLGDVAVEESSASVETDYNLSIYPNPAHSSVAIQLFIPDSKLSTLNSQLLTLSLFDLSGRLIQTLHSGTLEKGTYTFTPNIKTKGVYFVTLTTSTHKETKKLILMK